MLGSDKSKKKVRIGYGSSANVFKNMPIDHQQQQRASRRNDLETINHVKSKSLSPSKNRAHWCPPPGKTTKSTPINNQTTRNSQLDVKKYIFFEFIIQKKRSKNISYNKNEFKFKIQYMEISKL